MPIKAGWWDASLKLWDFSWSNKHCIHLVTKTIYLSHFVFAMFTFTPIKVFYSTTVCNAAEAWICLVSFYGREWWSKRLHCHMYFPQNNHFLHQNINMTLNFQYFFDWIKINETWKTIIHLITSFLQIFIIYAIDLTKNKMFFFFTKKQKYRQLEIEKKQQFFHLINS